MFPSFQPYPGFIIYTFGLTLTICFFLFLWMIKKLEKRYHFESSIFTKNILWYFLSTLIFSRLFYIIGKWDDIKYIKSPFEFFITSDYNFSLMGALFGFIIAFIVHMKVKKQDIEKYIDPLVITFTFVLFVGFIGSIFGGQVYGRETSFGIEIAYNHGHTLVPYTVPVFPLPIIYSIIFFILFSALYILSMYVHIRSLLGYMGIIAFSAILLIFEFFSGKFDILKDTIGINITQTFSILLIILCATRLFILMNKDEKEITILHKN